MAIDKRLVHFKTFSNFTLELNNGNIKNDSIVFIKDVQKIWTHGTYYSSPYSKEELDTMFSDLTLSDTNILLQIEALPKEAPMDGLYYARSNASWVKIDMEVPTIDLSMVDINGATLSARNTANCYVVKAAGKYKFPLVYGNAIKDGNTNSAAYTKQTTTNSLDYVNVNNTAISSPYIETDLASTVDGAELSVCDAEGIISDITVVTDTPCNFLLFTVVNVPDTGANAVISAKVGTKIVWSWHIWLWKDSLAPITVTNADNKKYNILPVNLASTYEGDSNVKHIKNWYYQWGRHVPLIGPVSYNTNTRATNYGEQTVTSAASAANIGTSLQYPATFFKGNSTYKNKWFNSNNYAYNLWNASLSTTGTTATTRTKTVYDPCPVGYWVGCADDFTGFSLDTVQGSFDNGFTFNNGAFIPVSGRLFWDTGAISKVGVNTGIVTSSAFSYLKSYEFWINSTEVSPLASNNWSHGRSVRPVSEIIPEPVLPPIVDGAIDLSYRDIHGNIQSSRTTANCYVVSTPGTYLFPLVYGNGIKNGVANTVAYTSLGKENQLDFFNFREGVIASPYIETDINEVITGAELSVCDTDGIFSDIQVISGNPCKLIQFKVKSVPATGANGVISAKLADGTIVWSWHVWIWEDDLTPITITNASDYNYDILPVNLASKYDNNTKTYIKNWFYLWGRSVPLICPEAYNSNTRATNYGVKTVIIAPYPLRVGSVILFPLDFFKPTGTGGEEHLTNYNWVDYDIFYNYWDANCSTDHTFNNIVVKTIYDPCPVGYCVGNDGVFDNFNSTTSLGNFLNGGRRFKANSSDTVGVFFPCSGYTYSDGDLSVVGIYSSIWTTSSHDNMDAYLFEFRNDFSAFNRIAIRSYGNSIRPVKEQ